MRLGPTLGIENSHVRFLGNLVLNLWDCGGQDSFMENYFESQKDQIFRNVEVLIYVFDIESQDRDKDLTNFKSCLGALRDNSKTAKVFVLVHKMDLIRDTTEKIKIMRARRQEVNELARDLNITTFGTSIWDETLYKAWSSIVYTLVPNVEKLRIQLIKFCDLCRADEVVLFEKATFLVISNATRTEHPDTHRYEKISNIIKQFKLSCSKSSAQFRSMQVKNKHFTAFIDLFTQNTYVMLIMSNPNIQPAATNLNIRCARVHFEKLVRQYV